MSGKDVQGGDANRVLQVDIEMDEAEQDADEVSLFEFGGTKSPRRVDRFFASPDRDNGLTSEPAILRGAEEAPVIDWFCRNYSGH